MVVRWLLAVVRESIPRPYRHCEEGLSLAVIEHRRGDKDSVSTVRRQELPDWEAMLSRFI